MMQKLMEKLLTSHLRPLVLLLLHPSVSPSCWQKYINRDTLALKFLPQQLLSQTLYWIIEQRIYMTNGVNRLAFGLHPYPNTLCLLRKSKYKSVPSPCTNQYLASDTFRCPSPNTSHIALKTDILQLLTVGKIWFCRPHCHWPVHRF